MRGRRLKLAGQRCVYHCISRIVGSQYLLQGEREKEVLRNQIWRVADFCGVQVLTYCVMSNHVHILLRTPHHSELQRVSTKELERRVKRIYSPEEAAVIISTLNDPDPRVSAARRSSLLRRMGDVSQYMKELKQRFSIWYNRNHDRFGTLWAERFKSVLVEDDPLALMTVAAYIDLNPVRAGLVDDPWQYRFCGYAESMGGFEPARKGIAGLTCGQGYWGQAIEAYRVALFGKMIGGVGARELSPRNQRRILEILRSGGKVGTHEALRCRVRYFTDGAVLGSAAFVQQIFVRKREAFGAKRRDGPRLLKGECWSGLACARDLRREVFS